MTSRTHQIYNIIFEHGFDPPPIWIMLKKLHFSYGMASLIGGTFYSLLVIHFMIDWLFSNSPFLRRKSKNVLLLLLIYCRGPFQPAHHSPINLTKFERWGKAGALTRLLLKQSFAFREEIPLTWLMISHPLPWYTLDYTEYELISQRTIVNCIWRLDSLADLTMIMMLLKWLCKVILSWGNLMQMCFHSILGSWWTFSACFSLFPFHFHWGFEYYRSIDFLAVQLNKGRGKKNRFFLGKSPKQRTPPTHRISLGLT